jgi:hypothetical protein
VLYRVSYIGKQKLPHIRYNNYIFKNPYIESRVICVI